MDKIFVHQIKFFPEWLSLKQKQVTKDEINGIFTGFSLKLHYKVRKPTTLSEFVDNLTDISQKLKDLKKNRKKHTSMYITMWFVAVK